MAMQKQSGNVGDQGRNGSAESQSLGAYLANVRGMMRMSLRDVEDASNNEVSNAYLSQLEKDKIAKPSPNVLHTLATVYLIPYETLMEKAGYVTTTMSVSRTTGAVRHGRAATFANANLTQEEEESLLEYLAFLRSRKGKGGKT